MPSDVPRSPKNAKNPQDPKNAQNAQNTPAPKSRRNTDLDPRTIRLTNLVGWCWLAVCLISVLVITLGFAPQLPATTWLYLPAGRGTAATAHAWSTGSVIATSWVVLLVFGGTLAASRRWSKPTRGWIMVTVIAMTVFFSAGIVGSVASASRQLGLDHALTATQALALIGPVGGVTVATSLVALATILLVPAIFKKRIRAA
jgi:hypothetical protein